MSVWNGPVNKNVTADFLVRASFFEADAFHLEFAAVLEPRNFKVEPLIGEVLLLDRNLRIDCLFTAVLQALI